METFKKIIRQYAQSEVCMGELLANISADGMSIEDAFEIVVSANNKAEAKRKAIERLQRKKITSLIRKSWPDNKKEVYVDEE